jgi:aminoglycoside phosphotransferase family enzyme
MPMRKAPKGASHQEMQKVASKNIAEFHGGTTYQHDVMKFGKAKADKIAAAAGLSAARGGAKKRR